MHRGRRRQRLQQVATMRLPDTVSRGMAEWQQPGWRATRAWSGALGAGAGATPACSPELLPSGASGRTALGMSPEVPGAAAAMPPAARAGAAAASDRVAQPSCCRSSTSKRARRLWTKHTAGSGASASAGQGTQRDSKGSAATQRAGAHLQVRLPRLAVLAHFA